ncbi:hypothetical protein [Chitinibacter sp. S2-10]|uniref:hypothetical protein n=1 Tax=Chitinibacter sp. S2-10 TaxID=3373597 RepID=UPI003977D57D
MAYFYSGSNMYNCPKCQCENTQKLSIIHSHGTSNIETTTAGAGLGGGGLAGGAAKTSGTSQSNLAKKYEPPQKQSLFALIVTCTVIGFIASFFWGPLLYAFVALGIYLAYLAYKENKNEFPIKYAKWNASFLCMRCENVFEVNN